MINNPFFKETDFKETFIGRIPKNWEVKTIKEICHKPQYGYTQSASDKPIGPKFLRITDIQEGQVDWNEVPYCKCPNKLIDKYLLEPGDILFTRTGATTGKTYLIDECPRAIFASYLIRLKPKEVVDPSFLSQVFNSVSYWRQIIQNRRGAAQGGLNATVLSNIKIPFPSFKEQQKIAGVLSIIDNTIKKSYYVIEKIERLKNGLMRDLLTKGIGHKNFKETRIGKLPKNWDIGKLYDYADVRYGLGQPPELDLNGIPMIRATNIKSGKIIKDNLIRLKKSTIPLSKNPFLKEGDIIVVRSGVYTGDVARINKKWKGSVAGYDIVVSPHKEINSIFLTYWLLSSRIQDNYFYGLKTRAAQPHLNASQVKGTPIPITSIEEQKEISSVLLSIDEKLDLEKEEKTRLEIIKRGIMDLLLTGKIRIKVN